MINNRYLTATLKILEEKDTITAGELAQKLKIARITAMRFLNDLAGLNFLKLNVSYKKSGCCYRVWTKGKKFEKLE